MSITDRQEIVNTINIFIKNPILSNAMKIAEIFANIKDKDGIIFLQIVNDNPSILQIVIDEIIKQLEIEYKINRVQNKNNQLILVY